MADGKMISSSSVQIDEENFPWRLAESKQPICPARPSPSNASRGGVVPSVASLSNRDSLKCLNLFSGPYARAEGLSKRLKKQFSWNSVDDVDNDPDTSGGWDHDILNDKNFARILGLVSSGEYDAMMVWGKRQFRPQGRDISFIYFANISDIYPEISEKFLRFSLRFVHESLCSQRVTKVTKITTATTHRV